MNNENGMYKVKYSIDGIISSTYIRADDAVTATNIFTNMYGIGKVQILDIVRV